MRRRTLIAASLSASLLILSGCGEDKKVTTEPAQKRPLTIGSTAGPQAEIAEKAAAIATKNGLTVKVIEFADYNACNEALDKGDIDANAFQHAPYLKKVIDTKHYPFTSIGQTHLLPLGCYSLKFHDKKDIPDGASVTIPGDPTNLGRALQLLAHEGLLTLKDGVGTNATLLDIVDNPKHLKIREVDSGFLGRSLPDVDFSVINGGWAIKSNLSPSKDAFILESKESEFAIQLVVRTADKDRPEMKALLKAYNSDELRQFINEKYNGSIVPAF